jgi:hypothetical protein
MQKTPSRAEMICLVLFVALSVLDKAWPALKPLELIAGVLLVLFYYGALINRLFLKGSNNQPRPNLPPRPTPPKPIGYRGPFWNKPTTAYLEASAQPFSPTRSAVALFAMLIPFGIMAYMFLH